MKDRRDKQRRREEEKYVENNQMTKCNKHIIKII
jgi:hypothetical protein